MSNPDLPPTEPFGEPRCPRCRRPFGLGDRFCARCGTTLPDRTVETTLGERRLTVFQAELRSTPELSAALAPDELSALLDTFHAEVRRLVEAHQGLVNQRLGEAVVALFGLSGDPEEGAQRAVAAGFELRKATRRLGETAGIRPGLSLHLRCGIDTGEVRTAPGDGVEGVLGLTGSVVQGATRLRARARDDEVWIGPGALPLVAQGYETEATEPLPSRDGVVGRAHRVLGRRASLPPETAPSRLPLVGRDWERAHLLESFQRAVALSAPVLVAVTGTRGAGKTRLVETFAREAPAALGASTAVRGVAVWSARCAPGLAGEAPFAVFRDLLRRVFGPDAGPARFAAELGETAATPARAATLAAMLPPDQGPEARPSTAFDEVGEPRASVIRDALVALVLAGCERDRPLLLCLDDWHRADRGSHALLHEIVEAAGDRPLLVVATRRPAPDATPGRSELAGRAAIELALEPLGEGALAELGGAGADPATARAIGAELARRTGGLALHAAELVRWARERAPGEDVDGPEAVLRALTQRMVPANVEGLVRSRLEGLDDDARDVLQTTAALGSVVPRAALERAWGRSPHLERALERLVAQGWLRADPHVDGFAFEHDVLREVAHDLIDPAWRLDLHGRALALLSERRAEPAWIALHAEEAGRPEEAAEAASRAGEVALREGDADLARVWFGRAIERLESLPETPERRRAWLAAALRWVAMRPVAHERHQLAVVRDCHARAMGLGLVAEAAEALRLEGSLELGRGHVDDALGCFERCLRLVGLDERHERARLYVWLARSWAAAADFDRARAFLEDALALRERRLGPGAAGDAVAIEARLELGSVHVDVGELDDAERALDAAVAGARASHRPSLEARAWTRLFAFHLARLDLTAAELAGAHVRRIGERGVDPALRALGDALVAVARAHAEGPAAGDGLERAVDALPEGRPVRTPSWDWALFAEAFAVAGRVRRAIGAANAALRGATRRDRLGEVVGQRALGLALVLAHEEGGGAAGLTHLRASVDVGAERGQTLEAAWSALRLAEVEAAADGGSGDDVRAARARLGTLGVTFAAERAPLPVRPGSGVRATVDEAPPRPPRDAADPVAE